MASNFGLLVGSTTPGMSSYIDSDAAMTSLGIT